MIIGKHEAVSKVEEFFCYGGRDQAARRNRVRQL